MYDSLTSKVYDGWVAEFWFGVGQCFQNCFVSGSLWLQKITTGPHILTDVTIECPDDRDTKLNVYTPTDWIKLQIHTSSIRDGALHDLAFIKMTVVRFMGTGGLVIRYSKRSYEIYISPINPLTPELNPSTQRCLTRFFTGDFASWTVRFIIVCVKNQQMRQLFIQFINYVW
jgi:hypothetical protein